MPKRTDLDEPITYVIPDNFISKGTILGGMFKTRNAVEALICVVAFGYPILHLPIHITVKLILLILFCGGSGLIALFGYNRGPISEFLFDFFKYKKMPKEYGYSSCLPPEIVNQHKEEGKSQPPTA